MNKLERIIKAVNDMEFYEAGELIEEHGIKNYLPDDVNILLDSYDYYVNYADYTDDYFSNFDDYVEFTQNYVNDELQEITSNMGVKTHNFTHLLSLIDNREVNRLIDRLEKSSAITNSEKQYSYARYLINEFDQSIGFEVYTNTTANFIDNTTASQLTGRLD